MLIISSATLLIYGFSNSSLSLLYPSNVAFTGTLIATVPFDVSYASSGYVTFTLNSLYLALFQLDVYASFVTIPSSPIVASLYATYSPVSSLYVNVTPSPVISTFVGLYPLSSGIVPSIVDFFINNWLLLSCDTILNSKFISLFSSSNTPSIL